jgi:hypothetical protein
LNLIELSRTFELLASVFENIKEVAQESSALGLPSNPDFIRKTQPLCRLPAVVQNGVIHDIIALPVAIELSRLNPDVSTALADLFCDLKIGLNKQREIITFIREIALREDLPPSDIIKDPIWIEIIYDKTYDRSLRPRKIRQYLKQRRFPTITCTERRFEKYREELALGRNVKLTPPRNFEGNRYTFSIDFKNLQELKEGVAKLDNLTNHSNIKKILHE